MFSLLTICTFFTCCAQPVNGKFIGIVSRQNWTRVSCSHPFAHLFTWTFTTFFSCARSLYRAVRRSWSIFAPPLRKVVYVNGSANGRRRLRVSPRSRSSKNKEWMSGSFQWTQCKLLLRYPPAHKRHPLQLRRRSRRRTCDGRARISRRRLSPRC